MLDDYKEMQSVAYNLMIKEIENNHVSHAYLIDENNCCESYNIVIAFVKKILCNGLDEEQKKILCKRIDDENYPEIKVIKPEGILIKKQQILDLQQEFSRAAVEGNKRIYIIRDADKMRNETANSMLKFLEEPDTNIIAILMTNNFNNLLSTIVSRCQVIRLNNDGTKNGDSIFADEAIKLINELENNGIYTIIKEQELLFNYINPKERDKMTIFFDKLIDMYYDMLKILSNNDKIKNIDYYEKLKVLALKNNKNMLLDKINTLLELKDTIKNNVNINLLIDSLILRIGGNHESSWS